MYIVSDLLYDGCMDVYKLLCVFICLPLCIGKVDDTVDTTPEHKRSNSEKVLPEENSLGNGQ